MHAPRLALYARIVLPAHNYDPAYLFMSVASDIKVAR